MRTILLIDDEAPTLEVFSMLLESLGYNVLTAENGELGMALFLEHRPEIVLTDVKMPGMDGIEVLKRVKEVAPETEVVIITGHGDMDLAIQALNLNATDFINKPVRREPLSAALSRADERLNKRGKDTNEIAVEIEDGLALLAIKGNVTSRSEPYLQEAFNKAIAAGATKLILAFDEHSSINGAGISILTQLLMESHKKGHAAALTGLSENFARVVEVVGITRFATLYDTADEARQHL